MTKLNIIDQEHFKAAYHFAKTLPAESRKSFHRCLYTINRLKRRAPPGSTLHIGQDFVKHSFSWCIRKDNGDRWYNGGMILHGFQETFSVQLCAPNSPNWSIHT